MFESIKKLDAQMARLKGRISRSERKLDDDKATYKELSVEKQYHTFVKDVETNGEKYNLNVPGIVENLDMMKNYIDNTFFDDAENISSDIESEIYNRKFQRCLIEISSTRTKILEASRKELDLTGVLDILNNAKHELRIKEFDSAMEYAKEAYDMVDNLLKEFTVV
ncbi:MAG: hypothetical protein KJ906_00110 [Nanoarchaeota archaeon]|nr:hypothetical protein [Nanoarchaeota archaeon]